VYILNVILSDTQNLNGKSGRDRGHIFAFLIEIGGVASTSSVLCYLTIVKLKSATGNAERHLLSVLPVAPHYLNVIDVENNIPHVAEPVPANASECCRVVPTQTRSDRVVELNELINLLLSESDSFCLIRDERNADSGSQQGERSIHSVNVSLSDNGDASSIGRERNVSRGDSCI
jgi:hypothetical protein